jgi:hypothetical protein
MRDGIELLEVVRLLADTDEQDRAPVILRTLSAAPPRASPSVLVRITPWIGRRLWNSSAEFTASCPCIESLTSRPPCGLHTR